MYTKDSQPMTTAVWSFQTAVGSIVYEKRYVRSSIEVFFTLGSSHLSSKSMLTKINALLGRKSISCYFWGCFATKIMAFGRFPRTNIWKLRATLFSNVIGTIMVP